MKKIVVLLLLSLGVILSGCVENRNSQGKEVASFVLNYSNKNQKYQFKEEKTNISVYDTSNAYYVKLEQQGKNTKHNYVVDDIYKVGKQEDSSFENSNIELVEDDSISDSMEKIYDKQNVELKY